MSLCTHRRCFKAYKIRNTVCILYGRNLLKSLERSWLHQSALPTGWMGSCSSPFFCGLSLPLLHIFSQHWMSFTDLYLTGGGICCSVIVCAEKKIFFHFALENTSMSQLIHLVCKRDIKSKRNAARDFVAYRRKNRLQK